MRKKNTTYTAAGVLLAVLFRTFHDPVILRSNMVCYATFLRNQSFADQEDGPSFTNCSTGNDDRIAAFQKQRRTKASHAPRLGPFVAGVEWL